MKFFKLATALFLAGSNAVVAAYEIPSDNLIAQLADAYNTEVGTYLPLPKCMRLGAKLTECANKIKAEADEDKNIKKWVQSYDKAVTTSHRCVEKAMAEGDANKIGHCGAAVLDIVDKYCPTNAYRKACGTSPFMFEEFIIDLADELEVAAFWEDEEDMDVDLENEFITKEDLKKSDEVSKKCKSGWVKIEMCGMEELGKENKDIEWEKSLQKAAETFDRCLDKVRAGGNLDLNKIVDHNKAVKCFPPFLDIVDKHCPTKALRKACGIPSFEFGEIGSFDITRESSTYGLRGSSFDEE